MNELHEKEFIAVLSLIIAGKKSKDDVMDLPRKRRHNNMGHGLILKRGKAEVIDRPEDIKMQQSIQIRTAYSLAILGKAFVQNGSGRFLNIRLPRTLPPGRAVSFNRGRNFL